MHMSQVYITSLDESTLNRLKEDAESSKPVWERYVPPHWGASNEDDHPLHIQVLAHWIATNKGIVELANSTAYNYGCDIGTKADTIYTLASIIERQFQELNDLIGWAFYTFRQEGRGPMGRYRWIPTVGFMPVERPKAKRSPEDTADKCEGGVDRTEGQPSTPHTVQDCGCVFIPIIGTIDEQQSPEVPHDRQ
jgi:hypothetical protein